MTLQLKFDQQRLERVQPSAHGSDAEKIYVVPRKSSRRSEDNLVF